MPYRYRWDEEEGPRESKPTNLTRKEMAVVINDTSGDLDERILDNGRVVQITNLRRRGNHVRSVWLDHLRDEVLAEQRFDRRVQSVIGFFRDTWAAAWNSDVAKSCRRFLATSRAWFRAQCAEIVRVWNER